MARLQRGWSHGKTVGLIWFLSAFLCIFVLRMAIQNSNPRRSPPDEPAGPYMSNSERRSRLYDKMARDMDEKGAVFLKGGQTSQSLSLSDIFTLKDGHVTPVLKAADPPIRANVLYLDPEFSTHISQAVRATFLSYFGEAIWFQNTSLYHCSMFHASHHLEPVLATEDEIEAEAKAVKAVSEALCPLKIVLDRVVLTSTGVLLGCWQIVSGTDPIDIRASLRSALPRAPKKQLYDPVMLHTSFARILGHPKLPLQENEKPLNQLNFFHELVERINKQLQGFRATISELWYVQEFDVLALALDGRMNAQRFHMRCSGS